MAKSLFNQLSQVHGSRTFFDDMKYAYAEQTGRHFHSGSMAVTSGTAQIDTGYGDISRRDVGNFLVIDEGDAAGVYEITAVSGTVATVDPTPTGTDASATARLHYYQNLEDDLNYLRKMMALVIGEDWNEEPNTDLRNMAYLIPKRPNYVGETAQYTERPGTVAFAISDIDQTGGLSSGAPAGEYTDNTATATAGDTVRFTDDSTMVISITGGFYPADTGTLSIMKDGVAIGQLDLAAAWTADGCTYEEEESDVGNNPDHVAGGGLDVFSLTNRRCMNTSVDGYASFWPPYQIASMSATVTLPAGYQGQITVQHSVGGSQNYTYATFWVDTTAQSITAAAPTISVDTPVNRYLSGVPYYDTGSTFTISGDNSDTLFDRGYPTTPMRFNVTQFNDSNINVSYANIGLSTPTAITDTIQSAGGYSTTITVGGGNFRDLDARATQTFWNVFTSATSASSAAGTYRIDTFGQTSTATTEGFDDEAWRFRGDEDFTDTGINSGDSNWDSTENVTTLSGVDNGLVVYNSTLKYPTLDHSTGFLPAGPDYSSQTGDFVYYRVFTSNGGGSFTNGTITFSGWSNALSTIQGSNVEVHLRYPNCTDYSNGNTAVWQDLSVDQTTFGGEGCLGSGSSGTSVAFSFGTTSSVSFGDRIIMRIKYKASSVTALTGITFNPTL